MCFVHYKIAALTIANIKKRGQEKKQAESWKEAMRYFWTIILTKTVLLNCIADIVYCYIVHFVGIPYGSLLTLTKNIFKLIVSLKSWTISVSFQNVFLTKLTLTNGWYSSLIMLSLFSERLFFIFYATRWHGEGSKLMPPHTDCWHACPKRIYRGCPRPPPRWLHSLCTPLMIIVMQFNGFQIPPMTIQKTTVHVSVQIWWYPRQFSGMLQAILNSITLKKCTDWSHENIPNVTPFPFL